EFPLHFMSCTYLNALRIVRHDKIVQVITRVARRWLLTWSPGLTMRISRAVMVISSFHSHSSIFDVTVVNPCTETYLAQHPLCADTDSEAKKTEIYGARGQDFQFF